MSPSLARVTFLPRQLQEKKSKKERKSEIKKKTKPPSDTDSDGSGSEVSDDRRRSRHNTIPHTKHGSGASPNQPTTTTSGRDRRGAGVEARATRVGAGAMIDDDAAGAEVGTGEEMAAKMSAARSEPECSVHDVERASASDKSV